MQHIVEGSSRGPSLVETFERETAAFAHDEASQGVEIVARRANRSGRTTELTVIVDRRGGVDLATCERLARRINASLADSDELYTLQVESAGLERPLLAPADYERFAGKNVRIVTTLPVQNRKTHRGTLLGLRERAVAIEAGKTELLLPLEMIKSANLEYDPRADLQRDKLERKAKDENR